MPLITNLLVSTPSLSFKERGKGGEFFEPAMIPNSRKKFVVAICRENRKNMTEAEKIV
jgi:hypothetical protein